MRLLIATLLIAAFVPPALAAPPTGDGEFAARLYGRLRAHPGNLFFSPASIRLAMAMAFAGARGETATEMQHALALPSAAPHALFATQLRDWAALARPTEKERKIVLRVVNRLWAQKGEAFRDEFLKLLRDDYAAPLEPLDFRKAPEPSRVAINKWVSDETEHKIKELIARGLITADTRMVLTNAVYFKAQWEQPFQKSATRPDKFFADGARAVEAPLMRQVEHFAIARIDGGQLLELPYASGELVMDVALPDKRDGLGAIEKQFSDGALPRWLAALQHQKVDVTLPRFKTGASFEVGEALGALGIKRAFQFGPADFSGIDGTRDLFISSVVHQAVVDVDENGTEAAAATAVLMKAGAAPMPEKPAVFRVDHPFLFVLRDARSGAILFAGRLVDPTK